MIHPTPTRTEKARAFVHKRKTVLACTATAATTVYLTTKLNVQLSRVFVAYMQQKDTMLQDAVSFIESKEMWDEFIASAKRLKRP